MRGSAMTDDLNLADLGRNPANVTLKDATDDEIDDEISRRYPSHVLLILRRDNDDSNALNQKYRGGYWTCIGMAQQFVHNMVSDRTSDE